MQFCHRVLPYHSGVHRQPHGLGLESTNGYIGFTLEYRESIGEEVHILSLHPFISATYTTVREAKGNSGQLIHR